MIVSFACKETEKIWLGEYSRRFPADIQDRALFRLNLIEAAKNVQELLQPQSNNLEALKGDRKGQWSIRINRQWRICFVFEGNNAYDLEIVDYH